jgi:HAD superfamily hydrolase (TIGR01458 family)
MAAILLDIDGVLQISGRPIDGAVRSVQRLREAGHRIRFLTNNTTQSRSQLAAAIRGFGIELEDDELQTTPVAAARVLKGRRVLALTMPAIRDDLEDVELVGDSADAVLVGGADESAETNRVFSYMNLGRAFAELEAGAELFCLHKNPWWQTSRGALLDSGVFVVGLEYATGAQATVLGKPSASYFEAALEAVDSDPEHAWMVGDDVNADIGGAAALGMHTILVRTGKFRDDSGAWSAQPEAVVDSIADVPAFLESFS